MEFDQKAFDIIYENQKQNAVKSIKKLLKLVPEDLPFHIKIDKPDPFEIELLVKFIELKYPCDLVWHQIYNQMAKSDFRGDEYSYHEHYATISFQFCNNCKHIESQHAKNKQKIKLLRN